MPHDLSVQSPPLAWHRPRRGFTLIEMLVVIGIILLLIGMSVAGFNQIARHTKTQHTKAVLEAGKAMLAEYEASAGKNNVASFRLAWDSVPNPINVVPLGRKAIIPPGPEPTWEIYTGRVLAKLLELPNNKAIFDKLPSDQIQKTLKDPKLKDVNGNPIVYYEILDGYGHPILFVPSVGIRNVTAQGKLSIIRSDDAYHPVAGPDPNPTPNPRYFWMSAGADNDPAQGDDNHYSFQQ